MHYRICFRQNIAPYFAPSSHDPGLRQTVFFNKKALTAYCTSTLSKPTAAIWPSPRSKAPTLSFLTNTISASGVGDGSERDSLAQGGDRRGWDGGQDVHRAPLLRRQIPVGACGDDRGGLLHAARADPPLRYGPDRGRRAHAGRRAARRRTPRADAGAAPG